MFYRLSGLAIMAALFPAATVSAQSSVQSDASTNNQATFPSGTWTNLDQEMVVRIAPCANASNRFCGTLLEDNTPGPAANPPGHILVRDLERDRAGWKGKIVSGDATLNFAMRPASNDRAQVRFCMGIICDSEIWIRVPNALAPSPALQR